MNPSRLASAFLAPNTRNKSSNGVPMASSSVALVEALGEASSEEEGLKAFEEKAKEIRRGACKD